MSIPTVLSEAESDLLDTTRRVLGANLSEFLLCGLGEPHDSRRRYTARSIREHGPGLVYHLEAVGESEKGLPGGRDPLVMAALLHLLWTGPRGRDEVVFSDEGLMGILSWPETQESRMDIAAAVDRYYCATYYRRSRERLGLGRGERVSSQVQKLVPAYDTTLELREAPPSEVRKSTTVHFTTKLVDEVSGAEKYFLGIDFERLEQLQTLPAEISG